MDGNFSLSLKKKGKGKKKKSVNIFGTADVNHSRGKEDEKSNKLKRRKIQIAEISSNEVEKDLVSDSKIEENLVIKMDTTNSKEEQVQGMTTQEEYDKVPVELFGEALLRGMGWDGKVDEVDTAKNDKDVIAKLKHPDNLGIGATPSEITLNTDIFLPLKKIRKVSPSEDGRGESKELDKTES